MRQMSNYQFTIKAHDRLGVLERILRVIRHRGGNIKSMEMQTIDSNAMHLTLTLATEKSIEALQSQVAKLVDVISIEK